MNNRTFITMAAGLAWLAVLPFAALAQDVGIAAQDSTMPSADALSVQSDAGTASDTSAPSGNHFRRGGEFKALSDSLSPEQQQQMAAIRDQLKNATAPLRQQMKELRAKLEADPQAADADNLKSQLSSLREQFRSQMKAGHEKMMAILNDDQKAQLEEMRKGRRARGSESTAPAAQSSESNQPAAASSTN